MKVSIIRLEAAKIDALHASRKLETFQLVSSERI